ncbi:MAG: DDE-type integrase/transposase/recombinase [Myxococcota bacterium]
MIGFAVFDKEPTSEQMCKVLDRAVQRAGYAPSCTITDQGVQFGAAFRTWCARHNVRPRFGAVGRYGSIAVVERFMRTLKSEGLRRVVPRPRSDF